MFSILGDRLEQLLKLLMLQTLDKHNPLNGAEWNAKQGSYFDC